MMFSDRIDVIICLAGVLTASVFAVDPYACTPRKAAQPPTELVLDCTNSENHVVTGFIRGGHVKQLASSKKQKQPATAENKDCPVPDNKTACWANPISGNLLSQIQECLWKAVICRIPVNGQMLGYPCFAQTATYLFAEQFKCINQSRIVHLCSNKEPQTSVKLSDGEMYILSKGYPKLVAPRLDCSLTITTEAESLRFESIYMNMHPKMKRQNGVASCDFDYLEIKPSGTGYAVGMQFCGREDIAYTVPGTSRVRFVSGPEKKHYGGFVVKVTAVSSAGSTEDKKAPVVAVSSSDSKVAGPAATSDKNKQANAPRTKNDTKLKSNRA